MVRKEEGWDSNPIPSPASVLAPLGLSLPLGKWVLGGTNLPTGMKM